MPLGFSATWVAAGALNAAPLRLLLKYGGDPNTADGESSRTALWRALEVGVDGHGWDNFHALLDAGANINRATRPGETIALQAVALGAFDIAEELLKRGYNYDLVGLGLRVQIRNIDPNSFPDKAAARERVIELLKERGLIFPLVFSGQAIMREDGTLVVNWAGGHLPNGVTIERRTQIIRLGEPSYDEIIRRVSGLAPGYAKGILRQPDDPIRD